MLMVSLLLLKEKVDGEWDGGVGKVERKIKRGLEGEGGRGVGIGMEREGSWKEREGREGRKGRRGRERVGRKERASKYGNT